MKARFAGLLTLALAVVGCELLGGMRVEPIATSAQRPSNVAVFLAVTDTDQPVPPLSAENFRLYEDGQLLASDQAKMTLLDPKVSAVFRTVLLLDMSGALDDAAKKRIEKATLAFLEKVQPTQAVSVYAFDGRSTVEPIGDFPEGETTSEIPAVSGFAPKDPSSNLHGAVIDALDQLDARLMTVKKPIRIGTLVVLVRGNDQAGRATVDQMIRAIEQSNKTSYAVGIGEDTGDLRLDDVGQDEIARAPDLDRLDAAFTEVGEKVARAQASHYLLSYCTPARAGRRQLEIEVVLSTPEGEERTARGDTEFDALGFGPGCDPSRTPDFVMPAAATPVEEETDGGVAEEEPTEEAPPQKPAGTGKKPSGGPTPPPPTEEGSDDSDEIVPPPQKPGYAPQR